MLINIKVLLSYVLLLQSIRFLVYCHWFGVNSLCAGFSKIFGSVSFLQSLHAAALFCTAKYSRWYRLWQGNISALQAKQMIVKEYSMSWRCLSTPPLHCWLSPHPLFPNVSLFTHYCQLGQSSKSQISSTIVFLLLFKLFNSFPEFTSRFLVKYLLKPVEKGSLTIQPLPVFVFQ